MSEPLFLGVDVGTQSLRAALFTSHRRAMAIASSPLQTTFPQPAWAEQHPDNWWHALCQAVPACLAQAGASADQVTALAIVATSCTVLAVDADGVPLCPALMWMDTRAPPAGAARHRQWCRRAALRRTNRLARVRHPQGALAARTRAADLQTRRRDL
jgi:sugar (pentulose or hexulose) kinase